MARFKGLLYQWDKRLMASGVTDAAAEVLALVRHASGLEWGTGEQCPDIELDREMHQRLELAIQQREKRVPIERIVGFATFYGIRVQVTNAVFKPYPESAALVRRATQLVLDRAGPLDMLDVGTGTGCILLALLKALPFSSGVGTDLDETTVRVAGENAALNGLDTRASFCSCDWTSGIDQKFDLIISNPPRTATAEHRFLAPETRYEPQASIDGGADGLKFYRLLAHDFPRLARPGAVGLFQVTPNRAAATQEIFSMAGSLRSEVQFSDSGKAFAVLVQDVRR